LISVSLGEAIGAFGYVFRIPGSIDSIQ